MIVARRATGAVRVCSLSFSGGYFSRAIKNPRRMRSPAHTRRFPPPDHPRPTQADKNAPGAAAERYEGAARPTHVDFLTCGLVCDASKKNQKKNFGRPNFLVSENDTPTISFYLHHASSVPARNHNPITRSGSVQVRPFTSKNHSRAPGLAVRGGPQWHARESEEKTFDAHTLSLPARFACIDSSKTTSRRQAIAEPSRRR